MHLDSLRQLAKNCRRSGWRQLGWPRDWQPGSVRDPNGHGDTFTEIGAWEYIAALLESGHAYEEVRLDQPSGAIALVMKIDHGLGRTKLYVKIQVGTGLKAIGRSFHYSDRY